MPWEIKLVVNGEPPQRIPVSTSPFTVGRHSTCHLRLEDAAVSRRHCTLTVTDDRLWVEDSRSLNGTLVNCRRIESITELSPGDVLRIGPFLFLVSHAAEMIPVTGLPFALADCHPASSQRDVAREAEGSQRTIGTTVSFQDVGDPGSTINDLALGQLQPCGGLPTTERG